jgi:hypothetical protein
LGCLVNICWCTIARIPHETGRDSLLEGMESFDWPSYSLISDGSWTPDLGGGGYRSPSSPPMGNLWARNRKHQAEEEEGEVVGLNGGGPWSGLLSA